jgi:citrate synthase
MTQAQTEEFKAGLDGVIAGESKICLIDGDNRRLSYRGYNVADLVKYSSFEETAYLLIKGYLPTPDELSAFKKALIEARQIPTQILDILALIPVKTSPMDMFRTIISTLSQYDPEVDSNTPEANFNKAIRLIAQAPIIIAAYHRLRHKLKPLEAKKDPSSSLAANFLYMLTGEEADEYAQKVFDICLILHADHCFNASTFTARVTAATLSDMHSAVTSAIGALKGPLHGGANQEVMELLIKVNSLDNVDAYINKMFEEGKKIPGFGHRVYRNCEDPRATILRECSRELGQKSRRKEKTNLPECRFLFSFDLSCFGH